MSDVYPLVHIFETAKAGWSDPYRSHAYALLEDPQATVDALVAAGVLEVVGGPVQRRYKVVESHTHDWERTAAEALVRNDQVFVAWRCSCGELTSTSTILNKP